MKRLIIAAIALTCVACVEGVAGPELSSGATKWCDWSSPAVGTSTNFYANSGTFTVADNGNGTFGKGVGEVAFTSNNPTPVAEHQFGNAIWGSGQSNALFDPNALAGKTGLELLVNVDSASTSEKICIKLLSMAEGDAYVQTVSVEKGSTQCVQFPLAGFKSIKTPEKTLSDFSTLNGKIQITDGWNGYPAPAQETWKCKFSNVYTYGGATAPAAATPAGNSSPSR